MGGDESGRSGWAKGQQNAIPCACNYVIDEYSRKGSSMLAAKLGEHWIWKERLPQLSPISKWTIKELSPRLKNNEILHTKTTKSPHQLTKVNEHCLMQLRQLRSWGKVETAASQRGVDNPSATKISWLNPSLLNLLHIADHGKRTIISRVAKRLIADVYTVSEFSQLERCFHEWYTRRVNILISAKA